MLLSLQLFSLPHFAAPGPVSAPLTPGRRAHRASAPPRCCHPPSAAVRRWAPSWPGCGTGSRSPHSASPSPRALPRPAAPGGAGAFGERRWLPRSPRVPRAARPGEVATEATRGRRSAWLGSGGAGAQGAAPALPATPTGEGVRKVCAEVGYAGDERKVRRCWGTLALCAPRVEAPLEKSGSPALGAPEARPSACPRRSPGECCSVIYVPRGLRASRLRQGCPSLGVRTLPEPDPQPATAPGGAAAVAGRRARRAALGQSCREAGGAQPRAPPRTLPGALALPAALALLLARPLSAAARSSRTQ